QILPLDETVEAQLVEQRKDRWALPIGRQQEGEAIGAPRLLRRSAPQRERPRGGAGEQQYEGAAVHLGVGPPLPEKIERAAQKSLAVMCPACSRSPDGLLALMRSANRGLITRAGSMSR